MIKIIATVCSIALPDVCHEVMITSSDFQELTMFSCSDVAAIAKWMAENHPSETLSRWKCVIGKREERGA